MISWLVVGLGNPGPTYSFTRHNIGFLACDAIADAANVSFSSSKHRAIVASVKTPAGPSQEATNVIVAKPTTYMNESGVAVRALASFYNIAAEHVIVIHDEIDLDPGRLRVKFGGGDNGHNGLKSIRAHLSSDYFRVRAGVGRPPGRQDPAKWVLASVHGAAKEELLIDAGTAADAALAIIERGLVETQNLFNR